MTSTMTNANTAKRKPVAMIGVDTPTLLATIKAVGAQPELAMQVYKNHRGITDREQSTTCRLASELSPRSALAGNAGDRA